ncbi:MAG: MarR family transcriptional regulator [Rhizobiales bacterium]|nr:MarR family transcriptional regulator [Hyphomicrobiales bacterium]
MVRKVGTSSSARPRAAKKASARKSKNSKKSSAAKKRSRGKTAREYSPRRRAQPAPNPVLAMVRPPPPGEGKRGEQGYLAYLLRQAQAATRLTIERALAELGVTTPQFVVLTMLRAYPGLSGADLARVALLTPQTVGLIIRNLERDGAIKKTPHPIHGRVLQWTLTRRGTVRLDKCRRHVQAVERRLAAGLSAKSLAAVRRWLARIAADFQPA